MTYLYYCESCKKEWEEEQKITDESLSVCVECGHENPKRLISAGNFILKGNGWYSDGYSKEKNKK